MKSIKSVFLVGLLVAVSIIQVHADDPIVGTWDWGSGQTTTIRSDGTVRYSGGNTGHYSVVNAQTNTYRIDWEQPGVAANVLSVSSDSNTLIEQINGQAMIRGTRTVAASEFVAGTSRPPLGSTVSVQPFAVYRLSGPPLVHLFTKDYNQAVQLVRVHGWRYEGIAFYASTIAFGSHSAPVYNVSLAAGADAFYTMDLGEATGVASGAGNHLDAPLCYISNVQLGGTVPLHRISIPNHHFYTTDRGGIEPRSNGS